MVSFASDHLWEILENLGLVLLSAIGTAAIGRILSGRGRHAYQDDRRHLP